MKVAVCLSGQARSYGGYEALKENFAHLNPVYFLATWREPLAWKALEAFKPRRQALVFPEAFKDHEYLFWLNYGRLKPDLIDLRKKIVGGEITEQPKVKNNRQSTLRMFLLMTLATKLVGLDFDYIIKCRVDQRFPKGFEVGFKEMQPNQIGCDRRHIFAEGATLMSDQCFWGPAEIMRKVTGIWGNLPEYLAEIEDSHGDGLTGLGWLHPETVLRRYATQMCGAEIVPSHVRALVHRGM